MNTQKITDLKVEFKKAYDDFSADPNVELLQTAEQLKHQLVKEINKACLPECQKKLKLGLPEELVKELFGEPVIEKPVVEI